MTLSSLLGNLPTAAWVLSLLTQSLALFLIGWLLTGAARRVAPPLKSGILLTLIILLVLLPLGILVFKSGQASLYQWPVSPVARHLERGPSDADGALSEPGPAGAGPTALARDRLPSQTAPGAGFAGLLGLGSVNPFLAALNVFGLVWLVGFIISLGRLVHGIIFISGFRSSLVRIPEEELSGALETARTTFPRTRLPSVHVSPAVDSPVALGIFHPMIVLPQSLAESLSAEELTSILIHETAHVRHLDQVSGLLQRLLTALYWWNPLAYALSASFSVAREDVSDNYAIQRSGARSYASCLVALAGKTSLITRLPAAVGMATRHMSLEDRVKNIVSKERVMATKMKRSLVVLLAASSVILGALVVRYSWTLTSGDAGARVLALPPGVEPQVLAADKDRIYVCEYENFPTKPESHIAIYSGSDFSLLAKIGQVGKGPGEFRAFGPGRFILVDGQIWAQDLRRTLVFSRDGTFQKEIQIPREYFAFLYPLIPINEGFVSLAGDASDVTAGNARVFGRLYDFNLRVIKEFYGEIPVQAPPPPPPPPAPSGQKADVKAAEPPATKKVYQAIPECIDFAVAEGKLFVADSRKGFYIAVFDSAGNPLYEIDRKYAALPVPPEYSAALKKKIDETQGWLNGITEVKFRSHFPAFYSFKIADGKIYISTYAEKDGLHELVVMDLKGKVLNQSFCFPLGPSYDSLYDNFNIVRDRYAISGDKIYYVAKSAKAGSYEVRIQDLK